MPTTGKLEDAWPSAFVVNAQSHGKTKRVVRVQPLVTQVGDAIGLRESLIKNWIVSTSLRKRNAFFCNRPDAAKGWKLKEIDSHPAIKFAFPVKNVHVTITDLGRVGDEDAKENVLLDAEFGKGPQQQRISEVAEDVKSQSGQRRQWRQPCPPFRTPWRLEMKVTADDPRRAKVGQELQLDRGVDEVVQFEVQMLGENDPRLRKAQGFSHGMHGMNGRPVRGPWIEGGGELQLVLGATFPGLPRRQASSRQVALQRNFL